MAMEGLEWGRITIPLASGVDTKKDHLAVSAPSLLTAENVQWEDHGGTQKRAGFVTMGRSTTAGGEVTTARSRAVAVRAEELLWFAAGRTYTRSEKEDAWIDRGRFESVYPDQRTVGFLRENQSVADRAEAAQVIAYIWQTFTAGSGALEYIFVDKVTRAIMDSSSSTRVTSGSRGRVIAANSKILVFYRSGTSIICDSVDPSDVYNTAGAGTTTIASDCLAGTASSYDVCLDGTHVLLAYVNDTETVTVKRIDSTGTVTHTNATGRTSSDAGGNGGVLSISYHSGSDRALLVRKTRVVAPNDEVRVDWLKGADATDDGSNVNILVATETSGTIKNVAGCSLTGQTGTVLWDISGATTPLYDQVRKRSVTSTTTSGTVKVLVRRSFIASRAALWTDGSVERVIVYVGHGSTTHQQPCQVLIDTAFVVGETNGTSTTGDEVGLLARVNPGEGYSYDITYLGHRPQIEAVTSSIFACALPFTRHLSVSLTTKAPKFAEAGVRDIVMTFGDSRAYRAVEEGKSLYGPGGYVWQYDGRRCYESGFLLYPELPFVPPAAYTGVTSAAGGSMTVGVVYRHRFYWEWRNAAGEREMSSYMGDIVTTMGGADTQITFVMPTLPYTNKTRVVLAVFRRAADGIFYRVSSTDPSTAAAAANGWLENNVNADSVSFVDRMADADITDEEIDYLSSDEVDNIAPPMTTTFAVGQARGFTIDPEDRSIIRFAKIRQAGDALAWNDALTLRVPQEGGDVTDVQVTENAIVVFKEKAIYVASGQGPDNTGVPFYPAPQKVADLGALDPRSVVRTPVGWLFESHKGIYRLGDDYSLSYVGAPIEDLIGSATIQGALHIPDKHQVRFVTTANGQFVFDYLVGEWAVWNGSSSGISAAMWGETPIHLTSAAPYEPTTTIGDDGAPYTMVLELGPIRPGSYGGHVSCRRLYIIGTWRGFHKLRVSIAYNDSQSYTQIVDHTPASEVQDDPEEVRIDLAQPKARSFRVKIEDRSDGVHTLAGSVHLVALVLEVGKVRDGIAPLGATRSM